MSFLERLKQQTEGRREKWKPDNTPTPRRVYDQIYAREVDNMEDGLRQHPPTDRDIADKDEGIVRTTKRRNR